MRRRRRSPVHDRAGRGRRSAVRTDAGPTPAHGRGEPGGAGAVWGDLTRLPAASGRRAPPSLRAACSTMRGGAGAMAGGRTHVVESNQNTVRLGTFDSTLPNIVE